MSEETEWETRKNKIDIQLDKQGWNVKNAKKVILEVDTKQSDFKNRVYKVKSETWNTPGDHAYSDYLLLDRNGEPLAIIEAKKTSQDPVIGQTQAEGYFKDIKKQTGKDVFIFLTNGYEIWFWNKPYENPRQVKGFHDQNSLERIRFQNNNKIPLRNIPINKEIIDRPYQVESVKRVLEEMERKNKRKFLIVQATGSGKTRVAISLMDILIRARWAERVLFLADRKALRDQAYNFFKKFLPNESRLKVFSGSIDKSKRIYVSTIQTFMECYQDFSPGDFDVIISDEAHRSIYNKWKDVFTYFDAIQIGLTATPSELIERDTFRFFECEDGIPTALYEYDDAVKDGWLVPFEVYATQTHFQQKGIRPEDVPSAERKKLLEKGVDPAEIDFEGSDIEKRVAVIGTNEAIVKEFMDNCLFDETGEPAKTIFFAISKKHAKRIWEAFERLYPEYKGNLARIIVSDDSRAQEMLRKFKTESWPRVAISVDMLDTGIDIPEVGNLVFTKPVFSKIKFWQMIGRGTRNNDTCTHKDWLPGSKKEKFLIFDCWKIFNYFDLHPEGRKPSSGEALPARIFLIRVKQLRHFIDKKDDKHSDFLKKKIINDVNSLPKESIAIRERIRDVELASSYKLWKTVGVKPIEFLKEKLMPLMRYQKNININEASFTLKVEQLALAILIKDKKEIERLKENIGEILTCLPPTITEVKSKWDLIEKISSKYFWEKINYEDTLMMLKEITPLMKYKRGEPRPIIVIDMDDVIKQRKIIEYGPPKSPKHDYVNVYRNKVEKRIKNLAERHPTIKKIKKDEMLTEKDLKKLEKTLNGPKLYITEEVLQKAYNQHKGTLVQFVKDVIGLYKFPDQKKRIEEAFSTFIVEKNYLNANQVNFLRAVQNQFIKKEHIDYKDFYEPPFTNFGIKPPIPNSDLKEIVTLCHDLEAQFFER